MRSKAIQQLLQRRHLTESNKDQPSKVGFRLTALVPPPWKLADALKHVSQTYQKHNR